MGGTVSGRSLYIFPATLHLILSRNLLELRFHAGCRHGRLVPRFPGPRILAQNDEPAGFVYFSNITGEGFCTLKGVTALVTIKQLARQA